MSHPSASKSPLDTPGNECSLANTVRDALKGKHSSVSEAFADDKKLLQEAANKHGDALAENLGLMAGKRTRR